MTRSQIMTLVCAVSGLALGLLIANLQYNDPYVQRGADMLYGALGFIAGYFAGGRLFLDGAALRTAGS